MDIMKSLDNWARRHDPFAVDGTNRIGHSSAYHRFFEGYTELRGADGKIVRIYTGAYYRPVLKAGEKLAVRALYVFLYIASAALYAVSALLDIPTNGLWYVTLPQACTLPMLFWLLTALFHYLPVKDRLEIAQYKRSSVPLKRSSLIGSVCAFAAAAAVLLAVLIDRQIRTASELLSSAMFFLSGACLFAINRMEEKIVYEYLDSTVDAPEGGVEID